MNKAIGDEYLHLTHKVFNLYFKPKFIRSKVESIRFENWN